MGAHSSTVETEMGHQRLIGVILDMPVDGNFRAYTLLNYPGRKVALKILGSFTLAPTALLHLREYNVSL